MNAKICPTCQSQIPDHAPGGFCPVCLLRDAEEPTAMPHDSPTLSEVAAAFPKLEILKLIGHGGMGFVYQARQPELDRTVALKLLSPALRRDPAFEERFAREARVLGKLKHPNIVTLYEHGESGGFFYLLMEYIDGVNLRQAMSAGRFTPEQALAIVPAICDALQSAHAEGVWHRDIKPENILLDRDGRVKIADFGIARILGDSERNFTLTRTGGQLGSVAYMAPEQHERPHSVDHRADIYSLGVVIYEMLTGELPLGRFPLPSQRAEVNSRIDEIVMRTLEKERELRQQSAREVKTEVEGAATMTGQDHRETSGSDSGLFHPPLQGVPVKWLILAPTIGLSVGIVLMLLNKAGVPMSPQFLQAVIPVIFFAALGVGIAVMKKGGSTSKESRHRGKSNVPIWPFMWSLIIAGGGMFLHIMGRSLDSSHQTIAIMLSITGRVGIVVGFVMSAFTAYVLRPSKSTSALGVFVGLAAIVAAGTGHPRDFIIVGLTFAAVVIWAMRGGKASEAPSSPQGQEASQKPFPLKSRRYPLWLKMLNAIMVFLLLGLFSYWAYWNVKLYNDARLRMPIGYQKVEFNDGIEFAFVHPNAKAGGCSMSIPLRVSEKWVPDSGQAIALRDETRLWIRCRVNKVQNEEVVAEVGSSFDQTTWEFHEVSLKTGSPNQSIRFENGTEVTVRLQLVGHENPTSDLNPAPQSGSPGEAMKTPLNVPQGVAGEAAVRRDDLLKGRPKEVADKMPADIGLLLGELGYLTSPNQPRAKVEIWGNNFCNFDKDDSNDWVIQVRSIGFRGQKISGTLIYDLTEHGWTCIAKLPGTMPVGWSHEFEGRMGIYTQEPIEGEPGGTRERYYKWDGSRYIEDRVEISRGG